MLVVKNLRRDVNAPAAAVMISHRSPEHPASRVSRAAWAVFPA
jgi:hypothetical protein